MSWAFLFALAVGLAMDAMAVSITTGIRLAPINRGHVFRLAFHFGLFQFMMPILGGWCGAGLSSIAASWGSAIASGLLVCIGAKMVRDAWTTNETARPTGDPTRGWSLILLSLATSLDALAVGVSYSLIHCEILLPSIVIGLVAGGLSVVGMRFGSYFGQCGGQRAEMFGGVLLIGLGARVLIA